MTETRTTCPYCGVGCGVIARVDQGEVSVRGDENHPANVGRLCVKGAALGETTGLAGRLLHPQVDGERCDWEQALATAGDRLRSIIDEFGPQAVAFYASGQLLTEDYYAANKLMKGFIGAANIDTNSRLEKSMKIVEVKHPLVKHKLGLMRENDISTKRFRELASEVGSLLTYVATADLATEKVTIEGWNGPVEIEQIKGKKITVVPILRAGLGMMEGVLENVPSARISVVGVYRDEETLEPVPYFQKLVSNIDERMALVVDPMLATGGSMIATIDLLKKAGCSSIKVLVLVAAPEGIAALEKAHPDVELYTASIDQGLNEHGYIIPGLGDAGDKIFGTK